VVVEKDITQKLMDNQKLRMEALGSVGAEEWR
jgi:hypothetical protein